MCLFYSNYMFELTSTFKILCCIFSTGLSLYSIFYLLPITSRNFALVTNIEMMKDQALIRECVVEQKAETAKAFCKFYRIIKTIKKEKFSSDDDSSSNDKKKTGDQGIINLVIVTSRVAFNKLKDEGNLP